MGYAHDRLEEVATLTKRLESDFPKETAGFVNFMKAAEAGPNISLRNKELINVALALGAQCEWCIAFHVRNAGQQGATRAEIVEAGFQAVVMHGGPALMFMTRLLEAADEYAADAMSTTV